MCYHFGDFFLVRNAIQENQCASYQESKGCFPGRSSNFGYWVLGIGKKFVLSVFLTDWVLKNHGKLFNTQHLIPNTQHPTLILFCLTGHWKNYGVSNIQYPTLNTQYPTLSKHDQHTDRKNTTTLFFLKNSRVLLYLFFQSKTVVFYCMFFRVKNVSETGLSVAPKFSGIGYWYARYCANSQQEIFKKIRA